MTESARYGFRILLEKPVAREIDEHRIAPMTGMAPVAMARRLAAHLYSTGRTEFRPPFQVFSAILGCARATSAIDAHAVIETQPIPPRPGKPKLRGFFISERPEIGANPRMDAAHTLVREEGFLSAKGTLRHSRSGAPLSSGLARLSRSSVLANHTSSALESRPGDQSISPELSLSRRFLPSCLPRHSLHPTQYAGRSDIKNSGKVVTK